MASASTLTKTQFEAVRHYAGPAIVIAGPGSGKTLVLTERVRFLIEEKGVDPHAILVTTFTEKAATEVRHRLFLSVEKAAEYVHVSTIHSLCMTIMQDYFPGHDLGARFSVLDAESQKLFILANKSRLKLGGRRGWLDLLITAAGYRANHEEMVAALYNLLTENDIRINELRTHLETDRLLTHDMDRILESYDVYCDLLRQDRLVDFAHLQTIAHRMLLEDEEVLCEVQDRFSFILVDEYQDTSPVQDEIFRLIAGAHSNIFVVGDENQSIYGFRGASVENFTRFTERYPDAAEYFLSTNFRSVRNIVETANRVLEDRIRQKLEARREAGNEILVIRGDTRKEAALSAVRFLKTRILEGTMRPKDIVFLYRKKSLADDIIRALAQEDLPYLADSDGRFLEREEIEAAISLFGYVCQDTIAGLEFSRWNDWWRPATFSNTLMALDPATGDALERLPRDFIMSSIISAEGARTAGITVEADQRKIVELNALRRKIADRQTGMLESLYEIFRISGIMARLVSQSPPTPAGEEQLYNLAYLTRLLAGYEARFSRPTAKGFLYLLYNRGRQRSLDQIVAPMDDVVKCMTVHKARGLEFPAVVITSLIEGDFPLRFREDTHVCGIPIPDLFLRSTGTSRQEAAHYAEELRLFYVALTRARDLVILTLPRTVPGRHVEESRFLHLIRDFVTDRMDGAVMLERHYEPPREVPVLSYTSVQAYLDCPLLYRLNHYYRFVTPVGPVERQGVVVHAVIQLVNLALKAGRALESSDVRDFVNRSWLPVGGKKADEKLKERIAACATEYYAYARENFSDIRFVESPFTFVDDSMIVRGKVDLVARDRNGKTVLIDFKARRAEGIEQTGVRRQLAMYRYSLDTISIDRAAAYTFWDNRLVEFQVGGGAIRKDLKVVSDGVMAKSFPPSGNGTGCALAEAAEAGYCFFSFVCRE